MKGVFSEYTCLLDHMACEACAGMGLRNAIAKACGVANRNVEPTQNFAVMISANIHQEYPHRLLLQKATHMALICALITEKPNGPRGHPLLEKGAVFNFEIEHGGKVGLGEEAEAAHRCT